MKCERGMCRAKGISIKTAHLWHLKRLNKMNSKLIDAAPFFTLRLFSVGINVVEEIVNIPYIHSTWLSLLFATNGVGVASKGKLFGVKSWNWKTTVMWREKREMNTGYVRKVFILTLFRVSINFFWEISKVSTLIWL